MDSFFSPQPRGNSMSNKYKLIMIFSTLFLLVLLDRFTKSWASTLQDQQPIIFFGGLFQITYAENAGAFLGLGNAWPRETRFVIFALFVLLGLSAMLWYLLKKESSRLNLLAYSFILAGGVGNLWDRIFHHNGHVVDFLFVDLWGPLRTGVFNIADVEIVIGVTLLILKEYYFDKRKKKLVVIGSQKKCE